jgi:agmatinase
MNKAEKIAQFDPNGPGQKDSNLFGLPFDAVESDIVILPVPWEVTVSYRRGAADGPAAIMEASMQVDLYDSDYPSCWKQGIYMLPIDKQLQNQSAELRDRAEHHINSLSSGIDEDQDNEVLETINAACEQMNEWVEDQTSKLLNQGKLVGLLGGDHSTPLGFFKALSKRYPNFGILQLDAHMDLRNAFEGFTYSHASIMYNALKLPQISKLVQVGIRDYCEEELDLVKSSSTRVVTFFDEDLKNERYEGVTWQSQVQKIVSVLPDFVYISFDIDGLDPKLCPNTGTPVAGGMEYHEAVYLLRELARSGKKIIGFDLNEVAPGSDEWDANVGARLLFKLCAFMSIANKR